ncbi:MAG TPA: hypothetical protein VGE29_00430 [Prosthecobacter sp.]
MKRSRVWSAAALLLVLIWAGVALVMHQTDHLVSWPEKVMGLLDEAPWLKGEEGTHESRQQHLDRVITHFNRLDSAQRLRLREDSQPLLDRFFTSLTEEEQKEYVDRTLAPHLANLDKALKLMPQEERKKLVARMLGDLKKRRKDSPDAGRLAEQDDEFIDTLIHEDPVFALKQAPLKTKMELAPMLEDLQARIQGFRR